MTSTASSNTSNRKLCLGIDPMPKNGLKNDWLECYENHIEMYEMLEEKPQWVKLNLAFFLRWGRAGIDKLEHACEALATESFVLLDGKFGEIGNSLNQYLEFTFEHLKADGVTINPFMGEHILGASLQKGLSHRRERTRIFVLGATSEFPQQKLSSLQHSYAAIADACNEAHLALDASGALASHIGLVIGANRTDALAHETIKNKNLPLLMPGIGAQGTTLQEAWDRTKSLSSEIIFPVSRSICEGGQLKPSEMKSRWMNLQSELNRLNSLVETQP
jgi:orotidine-5'-phosphate decarboxylase